MYVNHFIFKLLFELAITVYLKFIISVLQISVTFLLTYSICLLSEVAHDWIPCDLHDNDAADNVTNHQQRLLLRVSSSANSVHVVLNLTRSQFSNGSFPVLIGYRGRILPWNSKTSKVGQTFISDFNARKSCLTKKHCKSTQFIFYINIVDLLNVSGHFELLQAYAYCLVYWNFIGLS